MFHSLYLTFTGGMLGNTVLVTQNVIHTERQSRVTKVGKRSREALCN